MGVDRICSKGSGKGESLRSPVEFSTDQSVAMRLRHDAGREDTPETQVDEQRRFGGRGVGLLGRA